MLKYGFMLQKKLKKKTITFALIVCDKLFTLKVWSWSERV